MPQWNKAQTEVLESLGDESNILVAAAAGSGKTAVLVERIIRTVITGKAGIDEILVVTFTRAAAAQMKAKIIRSLEEKAVEDETGRMAKQLLLAEKADIMTIDSFCGKVVRENFSVADIDPAFDMFESDEVKLLQEEVVEEVMDTFYRESEAFRQLAAFLMKRNIDDSDIKKIIFNIYKISDSYADPDKWLEEAMLDAGAGESKGWIRDYVKLINATAKSFITVLEKELEKATFALQDYDQELLRKVEEVYLDDIDRMTAIGDAISLRDIDIIQQTKYKSFPRKPLKEALGEEGEKAFYDAREKIKKEIKIEFTEDVIAAEEELNAEFVLTMLEVAKDFRSLLMGKKKKLRKYEFADISHAAFQILFDREKGEPSINGRRLSAEYKYIYIDEYQDSSDLQENTLNALARRNVWGLINNVFMVGDVKQSIYRFRQARPELFMEKQGNYIEVGVDNVSEDGPVKLSPKGRLINLNMNYRSRAAVLDSVNYVFEKIMTPGFGGISYDEGAKLHTPDEEAYNSIFPGYDESLYENGIKIAGIPEMTLIERDSSVEDISFEEAEAVLVAGKIREIVEGSAEKGISPLYVRNEKFDPKKGESKFNKAYRPARYGDIVILMRALTQLTPIIRIFEQLGIPVQVEDTKGYFDAMEIMTVVSTLRVIDNAEQDIPYASMLLSHIGGLTDSDLAMIVSHSDQGRVSLAEKCRSFEEGYLNRDDAPVQKHIAEKLHRINGFLEGWVKLRPFITVSELIDKVIKDTDYESFVAAMPDGKRRVANLKMLKIRAEKLSGGRNVGLMDFIRYIDKCEIHDIDFGEASVSQNAGNVVRIMTIHKSKGLEFPIVILQRLGKQFMFKDMEGHMVVDTDYHVAVDNLRVSESGYRTTSDSIKKTVLKKLSNIAVKSEEARLLYVAMTRAQEALYMFGSYTKDTPQIPSKSVSMLDFIRYSLENNPNDGIIDVKSTTVPEVEQNFRKSFAKKSVEYYFSYQSVQSAKDEAIRLIPEDEPNPYDFNYPFEASTIRKSKASVSEIKHAEMKEIPDDVKEETDQVEVKAKEEAEENLAPAEILEEINEAGEILEIEETEKLEEADKTDKEKKEAEELEKAEEEVARKEENRRRAALRGTVIHALFEKINYDVITDRDSLKLEFDRVLREGNFTDEERSLVITKYLLDFYSDDEGSLFRRMKKAAAAGLLFREKQFIAGLPIDMLPNKNEASRSEAAADEASEVTTEETGRISISDGTPYEDFVVIQGIVDAFFIEDDEIVIVDYKTDRITKGEQLIGRYAAQMYLYGHALETITGKKVKDIIFYSTRIGEVHYSYESEFVS